MIQQIRNAFSFSDSIPKFLIMDNDSIFSKAFLNFLLDYGITPIKTSFHSPWQNGIIERFNQTYRKEFLSNIIPINETHLDSSLS